VNDAQIEQEADETDDEYEEAGDSDADDGMSS
jgi:hypothetical protein